MEKDVAPENEVAKPDSPAEEARSSTFTFSLFLYLNSHSTIFSNAFQKRDDKENEEGMFVTFLLYASTFELNYMLFCGKVFTIFLCYSSETLCLPSARSIALSYSLSLSL